MNSTTLDGPGRRRKRSRAGAKNVSRFTTLLAILLIALLAVVLLVIGARMTLAGSASYQAEAFLDDWQAKGQEPSERAWQVAHAAAQRAISLYPTHAGDDHQRLGHIYQWQHFRQPFGAPQANASRHDALTAFREATALRPNWPFGWVDLAYAKLYLLEFDSEFHQALENARQLGPWRIGVNSRLAEIGFIAWPQLDAAQRNSILESARRTVSHSRGDSQKVFAIAANTGMTDVLCAALDDESRLAHKTCDQQTSATADLPAS